MTGSGSKRTERRLPSRKPALAIVFTLATFGLTFFFAVASETSNMSVGVSLLVAGLSAAIVWLSGVRPLGALVLAVITALLLPLLHSTFDAMSIVLVVVGFQAAMRTRGPSWIVPALTFFALTVNDAALRAASDRTFIESSVTYPALMTALTIGLGLQSRRVLQQSESLVVLHHVDRQRAISDERRRIARDLHDVAAHHLSALVVRNKLATRIGTLDALQQAATFSAVTATDALDALRNVVRVLSADDAAPLDPQPSLADMQEVINRVRNAGLIIDAVESDFPRVGRDVEVCVVRIVQESLANVLRHRGPGRAWVSLRANASQLLLTIEDDGPTVFRHEVASPECQPPGSYGLLGMRERAAACGGTLEVGPSLRGGWKVDASLPIDAVRCGPIPDCSR